MSRITPHRKTITEMPKSPLAKTADGTLYTKWKRTYSITTGTPTAIANSASNNAAHEKKASGR